MMFINTVTRYEAGVRSSRTYIYKFYVQFRDLQRIISYSNNSVKLKQTKLSTQPHQPPGSKSSSSGSNSILGSFRLIGRSKSHNEVRTVSHIPYRVLFSRGDKRRRFRGTQRGYSSKPLKHSIVKRILVFRRQIQAYFYSLKIFHLFGFST